MKLAIISGTTAPGGGPRHIYSLLEKIDRKEWDITVCTHNDGFYWDKLIALGIIPYDLVLRKLSLSTLFKLLNIFRKEKPDLIHTHGKGPGLYGRLLGWMLGIPVVHTFHGREKCVQQECRASNRATCHKDRDLSHGYESNPVSLSEKYSII